MVYTYFQRKREGCPGGGAKPLKVRVRQTVLPSPLTSWSQYTFSRTSSALSFNRRLVNGGGLVTDCIKRVLVPAGGERRPIRLDRSGGGWLSLRAAIKDAGEERKGITITKTVL